MRTFNLGILLVIIGGAGMYGCAHTTAEKRLDEKLSQEVSLRGNEDLRSEANQSLEAASGLTAEQKAALRELRNTTRASLDQMRDESLRLRAVLIKDVLASNYDDAEVALIKKRMKDLEGRRLNVLFNAVETANNVLGREAVRHARFIGDFFGERPSRTD